MNLNRPLISSLCCALVGCTTLYPEGRPAFELALVSGQPGGAGYFDAVGTEARFSLPFMMTGFGDRGLLVSDYTNQTLRIVDYRDYAVSSLAGAPGSVGSIDSFGNLAAFAPMGPVAVTESDAAGPGIAVMAPFHSQSLPPACSIVRSPVGTSLRRVKVREFLVESIPTLLEPYPPVVLASDRDCPQLVISQVSAIVPVDGGTLYASVLDRHLIVRISGYRGAERVRSWALATEAHVELVAGAHRYLVSDPAEQVDGTFGESHLSNPTGLAWDGADSLYVADGGTTIRKLTFASGLRDGAPVGNISTVVGAGEQPGDKDGPALEARIEDAVGLAFQEGALLIVENGPGRVRRYDVAAGLVSTVARGLTDPIQVVWDATRGLFVNEASMHRISSVGSDGIAVPIAGAAPSRGTVDGTGSDVRWDAPTTMAVGPRRQLFVTQGPALNHCIRRLGVDSGEVSTIYCGPEVGADSPLNYDAVDDTLVWTLNRTADVSNLSLDPCAIPVYKLSLATGLLDVLRGEDGAPVCAEPAELTSWRAAGAQISKVATVAALDADAWVIASSGVVRPTIDGVMVDRAVGFALVSITRNTFSKTEIPLQYSAASNPRAPIAISSLVVTRTGQLVGTDPVGQVVVRIDRASGDAVPIAGQLYGAGYDDGLARDARFFIPLRLAGDGGDLLYIVESFRHRTVRELDLRTGRVRTVAGVAGQFRVELGALPARLNFPGGAAVVGEMLFISDVAENVILRARRR